MNACRADRLPLRSSKAGVFSPRPKIRTLRRCSGQAVGAPGSSYRNISMKTLARVYFDACSDVGMCRKPSAS